MKKLIALLLMAFALTAFGQRVTLTVTVTNRAVTGDTLVVNGVTRTFTNAQTSTTFLTNLTSINATKTNAFKQIASYPLTALTLTDGGTNAGSASNQFRISGTSISASLGGGWGYLTLSTQAGSSTFPMLYPLANVVGETNRTNQASDVVAGLNSYATNLLATNAGPLGNYLTKGASTQQVVIAPVQFNGTLRAGGAVALTNGFTRAVTNINPVTSNLLNYGNAIRSEGSNVNSLQVGSNATATALYAAAIGNDAGASAVGATAVGYGAQATNVYSVSVGNDSSADQYGVAVGSTARAASSGVAIGNGTGAYGQSSLAMVGANVYGLSSYGIGGGIESLEAYGLHIGSGAGGDAVFSMALGHSSLAPYSNSLALGPPDHLGNGVTSTTTNQLRLGTANHSVSIPGQLLISGTQSNTTFTGTNLARGAWAYPRFDLTTLAGGNNLAVPVGTNRYIRVGSGPASAATIVGMVGGATSGGIDGQDVVLFNDSGYGLTFAVNSVDPVPANRINTPTATDVTVPDQGWAQFFYDGTDARWKLINAYSGTNLVATATNVAISTNGTLVGNGAINFTTGVTGYVSGGTINLGVSAAGGGGSSVVTNGNQFGASTTLTIKDGVLLTNSTHYGGITTDTLVTSPSYRSTLQDQERVLGTDGSGYFVELSTPVAKIAYVDNVTSDIQGQLDAKATTNQLSGYVANNSGLATNLYIYGTTTNALRISSSASNIGLHVLPAAASATGIVVKAAASQTADLLRFENSSGSAQLQIRKDGAIEYADNSVISYVNSYSVVRWGQGIQYFSGAIGLNAVNSAGATSLVRMERDSDNVLQLGADAATATAQTLKAHDGSGTDKAGANLSINGGQSTGTGVGGALIRNTSLTGSTGSSANSYSVREYIYAGETTLTETTATGFIKIALPASKYAGVQVFVTTHADDATDFQATTDMFSVSAVAKSTAITMNISTINQSTVGSSGTLATEFSVTDNGDNTFTIKCDATSSLTQTTLKAKWQIRINSDAAATVTPL